MMNVLDLKKELKQYVKNVYVISGNDSFLINIAISSLKESLIDAFEEFNYVQLDGQELKEADLKVALSTLPFGAANRLIVIKNLNQNTAKVINEFANTPFYNVVVACVSPTVNITGEIINCDHLTNVDLKKYIVNLFNKQNINYSQDVVDYIIDISSNDLNYITNELNKVFGYLDKEEELTKEIVKLLFTKNESYFVYNLTNAIDNKDIKTAMKILNNLKQDVSISEIFIYMGSYFRKMFYCAINGNSDELASILKQKPYAITKSMEYINKNGKSFYINLYNKYVQLDYDIKSGKISPINAIYNILLI